MTDFTKLCEQGKKRSRKAFATHFEYLTGMRANYTLPADLLKFMKKKDCEKWALKCNQEAKDQDGFWLRSNIT